MYIWKGIQGIFTLTCSFVRENRLSTSGKITLFAVCGVAAILFVVGVISFNVRVSAVSADNVTTSVYVLNTPPQWTTDAEESVASATTTPTNAGGTVTWVGTADDSNNDSYYLLICKTAGAPTANSGAPPTCNGGMANRWAVSSLTASESQATAATTTKETFPFNAERNDWYAWICDGNASLAQCNATFKQGNGDAAKASPFFVNHPPVFSNIVNTSPVNPGSTITWTATAYDNDTIRGSNDTVQLLVCKANDFTGYACGAGGTWATSTLVTSDPATTTTIVIPTQDKVYAAYVFVADNFYSAATSTSQGSNSSFTVSNVAPSVTASTISLVDPVHSSTTLVLSVPHSTSGPYWIKNVQITDNNSCLNASSGNEITTLEESVYRSGVGSTSCRLNVAGDYNSNNCYTSASPLTNFICTQDAGSCSGASDSTATFTCVFSLWYNADPTDSDTPWTAENWLAIVRATDDNSSTGSTSEATSGTDLTSFLAFDVSETAIAYGGLQPGQQSPDPLSTTTTLLAYGNVGLDEDLYGDTMCPTWSAPDSCDTNGVDPTNDIPIDNQVAATSSVAYGSPYVFTLAGSTTPTSVAINVKKTTATTTPEYKFTYWGISIPIAITVAGSYTGQNTITAITSAAENW